MTLLLPVMVSTARCSGCT